MDNYRDEMGRMWIWENHAYKIMDERPFWMYHPIKKTPRIKRKPFK